MLVSKSKFVQLSLLSSLLTFAVGAHGQTTSAKKTSRKVAQANSDFGKALSLEPSQSSNALGDSFGTSWFYPQSEQHDFILGSKFNYFSNPNIRDYSTNNDSQVYFDYVYKDHKVSTEKKVEFIYGMFPSKGINYYALPEFYWLGRMFSADYNSVFEYSIGRKHKVLNQIDDRLDLGLFSPIFSQDSINFRKQGLIGLEGSFKKDWYQFSLGLHPIFIPNQGPSYKEQDGRLIFASRWGSRLPETAVISGNERPIDYAIADYDVYKIASHAGFSTGAGLFDLQRDKVQLNAYYNYTPMNEIVISREIYADIGLNGHAKVTPVVRYSHKYGADLQTKIGTSTFGVSYLKDDPKNKLEDGGRAVQFFDPIEGYSVYFDSPVFQIFSDDYHFSISYSKFNGGEIYDYEEDGSLSDFTFQASRLRYREPVKVDLFFPTWRVIGAPLKPSFGWIYDAEQEATLLSMGLDYKLTSKFLISFRADILGTEKETEESTSGASRSKDLFIRQHKTDDRISGEIQYVF